MCEYSVAECLELFGDALRVGGERVLEVPSVNGGVEEVRVRPVKSPAMPTYFSGGFCAGPYGETLGDGTGRREGLQTYVNMHPTPGILGRKESKLQEEQKGCRG